MNPMIQNDQKYNLHYNNIRGDVLRLPHGTTVAAVKINEFWIVKSFGGKVYTKEIKIQSTLVISTSVISNNRLSRRENLIPV